MKFLLLALGSAGDVHPFIGLGAGLARRGHAVSLAANGHFQSAVEGAGLRFLPLGTAEEYEALAREPDLWHPTRAFPFLVKRAILPSLRPAYDLVAARDPKDTVVAASTLVLGARLAQEKLGFRLITVHLQPSIFMSASAPAAMPGAPPLDRLPPFAVRFLLRAAERLVMDPLLAPGLNGFRAELGLPPVRRVFSAWMHSPWKVLGLFPDWYAPPQADWPPRVALPGFIGHDRAAGAGLDAATEAFLSAGAPPVLFTAGSAMRQGGRFFSASLEACLRTGRRGLFVAAPGEQIPTGLPPAVHHAAYLPFSLVFPRTAAVVHHGGIGTTAQALAAGVPQLVVALTHDQPDNARRLERLGVGAALPAGRYTGRRAAQALERLLGSEAVRTRCRELRERVDFQGALTRACDALEAA